MAVELAVAYVPIVPSFKGIERRIADGISEPLAEIAGRAGREASKTIQGHLNTAWARVAKTARDTMKAAVDQAGARAQALGSKVSTVYGRVAKEGQRAAKVAVALRGAFMEGARSVDLSATVQGRALKRVMKVTGQVGRRARDIGDDFRFGFIASNREALKAATRVAKAGGELGLFVRKVNGTVSMLGRVGKNGSAVLLKGLSGLSKAGTDAAERFTRSFRIRLTRGMKGASKLAVTSIAGVLGAALVKGFGRLSAIDDATAKLEGLGHSGDTVKSIMGDALASVKGTAFGLDEAAGLSGKLVAAGIKPGEDLQRVLKLTADSATIAGSSLSDMGSVWAQVASKGKLQGDDAMQLLDRGIPIWQMVGKVMGVTAGEAQDLGSKGQVSFATFAKAMEQGLGGAAMKSGKTTTSAFRNMNAALGRFGAAILKDIYPVVGPFFTRVTGFLDKATEHVGPLVKIVGEKLTGAFNAVKGAVEGLLNADYGRLFEDMFGFTPDFDAWGQALSRVLPALWGAAQVVGEHLSQALKTAGEWIEKNRQWLLPLVGVVSAATGAFAAYLGAVRLAGAVLAGLRIAAALAAGGVRALTGALVANPIGLVVAALAALVAGAVIAYNKIGWFRDMVDAAWTWITTTIGRFMTWFQTNALPGIQAVVQWLGDKFTWLWQSVVVPVFEAIGAVIRFVWDKIIAPVFKAQAAFITGVLAPAAIWLWKRAIEPAFHGLGQIVKGVWENVVKPTFEFLSKTITKTLPDAFGRGVSAVQTAWDRLKEIAKAPIRFVVDTIINGGFIRNFNRIASVFGAEGLPELSLPGFARGGYTGDGGTHEIKGLVHGGEHVITKWARRRIESTFPGFFDYINATGEIPDEKYKNPPRSPHNAMGAATPSGPGSLWGAVPSAAASLGRVFVSPSRVIGVNLADAAKAWMGRSGLDVRVGSGYPNIWAKEGPTWGYAWGSTAGEITVNPVTTVMLPASKKLAILAHEIGHALSLGHNNGHSLMHWAVAAADWPTAEDEAGLQAVYGAPGAFAPKFGNPGGGWSNPFAGIAEKFIKLLKDKFPGGMAMGDLAAGFGKKIIGDAIKSVKLFDGGGWLYDEGGPQLIEHKRAKPDAVLTHEQWRDVHRIVQRAQDNPGGADPAAVDRIIEALSRVTFQLGPGGAVYLAEAVSEGNRRRRAYT